MNGPLIIPFGIGAIKVAPVTLHGVPMYGICPQPRHLWGKPGQGTPDWVPGQPKEQIPEGFVALAFQNPECLDKLISELVEIRHNTDWSAVPQLRDELT